MPRLIDAMIRHLETIPHGTRFYSADFLPVLENFGYTAASLSGTMSLLRTKGLIVSVGTIKKPTGGRPWIIWTRTAGSSVEPFEKMDKFKPTKKLKKSEFGDLVRSQLVARHA